MSVTHVDFQSLADKLMDGATEMEWRDGASRAYYAAYHRAGLSADLCPDNAHLAMGSHERLTNRFDLHNTKQSKSISYVLQSMKRIRHSADYEIDDPFGKTLAVNQVAQCAILFAKLDAFDVTNRAKIA